MAKKSQKKEVELTEEEIVHEAEKQGLLEHEEAEKILEEDSKIGAGETADDESDVKRPELQGKQKPKYEHPGDNNMSREVIEDKSKKK